MIHSFTHLLIHRVIYRVLYSLISHFPRPPPPPCIIVSPFSLQRRTDPPSSPHHYRLLYRLKYPTLPPLPAPLTVAAVVPGGFGARLTRMKLLPMKSEDVGPETPVAGLARGALYKALSQGSRAQGTRSHHHHVPPFQQRGGPLVKPAAPLTPQP